MKHYFDVLQREDTLLGCVSFTDEDYTNDRRVSFRIGDDNVLYVFFEFMAVRDSWHRFLESERLASGNPYGVNQFVWETYFADRERILNAMNSLIMERMQEGKRFARTEYVGIGIGGCIATLLATVSPPHSIVTFGMPAFCTDGLWDEIESLDNARSDRMFEAGFPARIPKLTLRNYCTVWEDMSRSRVGGLYDRLGYDILFNHENKCIVRPRWWQRLWAEFHSHGRWSNIWKAREASVLHYEIG